VRTGLSATGRNRPLLQAVILILNANNYLQDPTFTFSARGDADMNEILRFLMAGRALSHRIFTVVRSPCE
jgi:hypothetical protein